MLKSHLINLPAGPLGIVIARDSFGRCIVRSKSNLASQLLVGDIIDVVNTIQLTDTKGGPSVWGKIFRDLANFPREIIIRRPMPVSSPGATYTGTHTALANPRSNPDNNPKERQTSNSTVPTSISSKGALFGTMAPLTSEPLERPLFKQLSTNIPRSGLLGTNTSAPVISKPLERPPLKQVSTNIPCGGLLGTNTSVPATFKPLERPPLKQVPTNMPPNIKEKPKVAEIAFEKKKPVQFFSQLPTYRMPLNKYPSPGSVCRRQAYYATLNNDSYASIAAKLGIGSWKDLHLIQENFDRYGKVSSKSQFFKNTLIRIPTEKCEQWRLKNLGGKKEQKNIHLPVKTSQEPNAYLEKIRAKRKRNAEMLRSLGLGSPPAPKKRVSTEQKEVAMQSKLKAKGKKRPSNRLATSKAKKAKKIEDYSCYVGKRVAKNAKGKKRPLKRLATSKAKKAKKVEDYSCYVGKRVAKVFSEPDEDGNCTYRGMVLNWVVDEGAVPYFRVLYSDGDEEDVGLDDLKGA
jgi:hypothetical protein